MLEKQRQRAITAFQDFLNVPLETKLAKHQHHNSELEAIALFHSVAATVPAYQKFLEEHSINPAAIQTYEDFQKLPLITKENYLQCHSLADLCRNGQLETCDFIAVSSGY